MICFWPKQSDETLIVIIDNSDPDDVCLADQFNLQSVTVYIGLDHVYLPSVTFQEILLSSSGLDVYIDCSTLYTGI